MDDNSASIDFTTFGMFIIDQIHFPDKDDKTKVRVVDDIIGGAGTYGILGARVHYTAPILSKHLGWIVDAGSDFPHTIREELEGWGTTLVWREDDNRLTTRGGNWYGEGEHRGFKYLTPKLRLSPSDLISTPLLNSRSFHLICSPLRAQDIVRELASLRATTRLFKNSDTPLLIWEPVPDLCTPEHLADCLQTLHQIDVASPNAEELCAFYGISGDAITKQNIEFYATKWVNTGFNGAVIVRAGKEGCMVAAKNIDPSIQQRSAQCNIKWLPPYHTTSNKVVDPTGGGNAFIGGLAIGLLSQASPKTQSTWTMSALVSACVYANVSASFAIEQIGTPKLSTDGSGREVWNGEATKDRVEEYLRRIENV